MYRALFMLSALLLASKHVSQLAIMHISKHRLYERLSSRLYLDVCVYIPKFSIIL